MEMLLDIPKRGISWKEWEEATPLTLLRLDSISYKKKSKWDCGSQRKSHNENKQ